MARHGISYDDVISAANTLKTQGKNVTIENIRSLLGTGSSGTINQHLRRWKEAQQTTQKIASKENLPEGLISLVKGLWEGVLAQSTEQFTPIESNYQQKITELNTELEKYRSNNQRWQNLFNQWQQEKAALSNEKLTLEQALEFSHKENTSLHSKIDTVTHQLQEKQERIDELNRLHKQAQENLEHYRESAREQRLLDQQQFEKEKQQLQRDLKTTNEQLATQRERASTLEQKNQLIAQSYSTLENIHNETKSLVNQLKRDVSEHEKSKIELAHLAQHWEKQCQEKQKTLDAKISEVITIQADLKSITQQLKDTKQLMQDLQNQNKLLASEKWELAQEKAQLEGQVRQMQKSITV